MFCFNSKKVGYVKKTHGVKGELIIELDFKIPKKQFLDKWVFLEHEGTLIPFSIEYYQIIDEKTFIIKLQQINSIENAKRFSLCNFYVSKELPWVLNTELKIIGYKLFDNNNILLGVINDYLPIKNNPIVQITHKNQKYLIPINKELIIKQDDTEKIIYLKLSKDELINS